MSEVLPPLANLTASTNATSPGRAGPPPIGAAVLKLGVASAEGSRTQAVLPEAHIVEQQYIELPAVVMTRLADEAAIRTSPPRIASLGAVASAVINLAQVSAEGIIAQSVEANRDDHKMSYVLPPLFVSADIHATPSDEGRLPAVVDVKLAKLAQASIDGSLANLLVEALRADVDELDLTLDTTSALLPQALPAALPPLRVPSSQRDLAVGASAARAPAAVPRQPPFPRSPAPSPWSVPLEARLVPEVSVARIKHRLRERRARDLAAAEFENEERERRRVEGERQYLARLARLKREKQNAHQREAVARESAEAEARRHVDEEEKRRAERWSDAQRRLKLRRKEARRVMAPNDAVEQVGATEPTAGDGDSTFAIGPTTVAIASTPTLVSAASRRRPSEKTLRRKPSIKAAVHPSFGVGKRPDGETTTPAAKQALAQELQRRAKLRVRAHARQQQRSEEENHARAEASRKAVEEQTALRAEAVAAATVAASRRAGERWRREREAAMAAEAVESLERREQLERKVKYTHPHQIKALKKQAVASVASGAQPTDRGRRDGDTNSDKDMQSVSLANAFVTEAFGLSEFQAVEYEVATELAAALAAGITAEVLATKEAVAAHCTRPTDGVVEA